MMNPSSAVSVGAAILVVVLGGCHTTVHQPTPQAQHAAELRPINLPPVRAIEEAQIGGKNVGSGSEEGVIFATPQAGYEAADRLEAEASDLSSRDLSKARALWHRAQAILEWVLRQQPNNFLAVYALGSAYDHEGRAVGKADLATMQELHSRAFECYTRASQLQPYNPAPVNSCGLMWDQGAQLTATRNLADARKLWRLSRERFMSALQLNPVYHSAANNLGNAFAANATAVLQDDFDEAQRLWDSAAVAYQLALKIKPDKVNAATNWGMVLNERADTYAPRDLTRAQEFWRQAREKLKAAHLMDATYVAAPASWARGLIEEGRFTVGFDSTRAREFWAEARQLLWKALELAPADTICASHLAVSLELETTELLKSDRRAAIKLLESAIDAARQGLQNHAGAPVVMACLADALRRKAEFTASDDDENAQTLWREADDQFALSWKIRPSAFAAERWAISLAHHAGSVAQRERSLAVALWMQSIERYGWAADLDPKGTLIFEGWGDALMAWAETEPRNDSTAISRLTQATTKFKKAQQLRPGSGYAIERFGCALYQQAERIWRSDRTRAIALCHEAGEKFQQAIQLEPHHETARHNWALVLEIEARCIESADPKGAMAIDARAVDLLREHVQMHPGDPHGVRLFGRLLGSLAFLTAAYDPAVARGMWEEAERHMEARAGQGPDDLAEWSRLLELRANAAIDTVPERMKLFDRAVGLCERATATATVLAHRASVVINRSDLLWISDPKQATDEWKNAAALCERAAALDPNNINVRSLWGLALMRLFMSSVTPFDPIYLERAQSVMLAAPDLERGPVAYNLACTYALKQQPAECVRWLELARAASELPSQAKVVGDSYLVPVKTSPEFQQWLAMVFPN